MTYSDDNELNQLPLTDCPHLRWITSEIYGAGEIVLTSRCDVCGVAAIEKYRFTEGYTLHSNGTQQRFYL